MSRLPRYRHSAPNIEDYAAHVAGAALRHDFGIPITSIGRNLQFIDETIQDMPNGHLVFRQLSKIKSLSAKIDAKSIKLHNLFIDFGERLKDRQRVSDMLFHELNSTIVPLMQDLEYECVSFQKYLLPVQDDEIQKLSREIVNNAERVKIMYSGLHLFFRLQTIDETNFSEIDLRRLISRIARSIRVESAGSHLRDIPVDGEATVDGITPQLSSLFQNLLHNAAKFSSLAKIPKVTVDIQVAPFTEFANRYNLDLRPEKPRDYWVAIRVSNSGPRILADDAKNIFKLYYSKSPEYASFTGTGMGLAIAKLVVTIHRGLIFVSWDRPETTIVTLIPVYHLSGIDLRILTRIELGL